MPRQAEPLMRSWTGEVDATTPYINAPHPPARAELLIGADLVVLSAAMAYCQPALMFDSVDTPTRRFTLITPPFALQALPSVTVYGEAAGAFQGNVEIDTTTSGSLGTSYDLTDDADTIAIPNGVKGTATYADTSGLTQMSILAGAATVNRAPPAQMNRQIDLAEGLLRQVEDVETKNAHGFGLSVTVRTEDMEVVT